MSRRLLNYEDGVDDSPASTAIQFVLVVVTLAAAVIVGLHESMGLVIRDPTESRDGKPARFAAILGNFLAVFVLAMLSTLFYVIARLADPDDDASSYKGLVTTSAIFLCFRGAAMALSTTRTEAGGRDAPPPLLYGAIVLAAAGLVVAIVVIVLGIELLMAARIYSLVASFMLAMVSLAAVDASNSNDHQLATNSDKLLYGIQTGHFLMFVGAMFLCAAGVLFEVADPHCAESCPENCIFSSKLTHEFWFGFLEVVGMVLLLMGLVGPQPPQRRPSFGPTVTKVEKPTPKLTVTTITPAKHPGYPTNPTPQGRNDGQTIGNPAYDPGPDQPAPGPDGAAEVSPYDPPVTVPAPGAVRIDDRLLRKMYDLFTAADACDADAGLSKAEFATRISIAELKKALEPIGGLRLKSAGGKPVDSKLLFWHLDRNSDQHITIKEFLVLIETRAKRSEAKLIQDAILKKLYDMFSSADADPDTHLTATEFSASISVAELEDALKPLAALNIGGIIKNPQGHRVSPEQLFKVLDKNGDNVITIREFLRLIETRKGSLAG